MQLQCHTYNNQSNVDVCSWCHMYHRRHRRQGLCVGVALSAMCTTMYCTTLYIQYDGTSNNATAARCPCQAAAAAYVSHLLPPPAVSAHAGWPHRLGPAHVPAPAQQILCSHIATEAHRDLGKLLCKPCCRLGAQHNTHKARSLPHGKPTYVLTSHTVSTVLTGHQSKQNPAIFTAHLNVSQLVEVCGEQRWCGNVRHDVLGDGPGQAKPIIGGCAATQLVDDDERPNKQQTQSS
mgnify:CR=1 FL=1